jgi:hypothetical protein
MTAGFWTGTRVEDPAMQYRFRVILNGEFLWWAKTCDKPKINIPVLGKDEYYLGSSLPDVMPGTIVDFQPITMTMIDPVEPHFSNDLLKRLASSSDCFPRIDGALLQRLLGELAIEQINHTGAAIETWTLQGAFPTSIDFGSLDYSSDELVTLTMSWEFKSFKVRIGGADVLVPQADSEAPSSFELAIGLDGNFS